MSPNQRARSSLVSVFVVVPLLLTGVCTTVASGQSCDVAVRFDRDDFNKHSATIDNKWLPMVPGTQAVFTGSINQGGGPVAVDHQVVFTITDLTKVIKGVRTRVVYDVDINAGEVVEAELAFFAQDKDGNVWNLGEYPEAFEEGEFAGAPFTWIAGQAGAKAGIHMFDDPRPATFTYSQGFAPMLDPPFLDCGQVVGTVRRVDVPAGRFKNILVTYETSPLEPDGGVQVKYYAAGVGIVLIGAVGDPEAETLVLTERVRLSRRALSEIRDAALELDRRAYEGEDSFAVYRKTRPAEEEDDD